MAMTQLVTIDGIEYNPHVSLGEDIYCEDFVATDGGFSCRAACQCTYGNVNTKFVILPCAHLPTTAPSITTTAMTNNTHRHHHRRRRDDDDEDGDGDGADERRQQQRSRVCRLCDSEPDFLWLCNIDTCDWEFDFVAVLLLVVPLLIMLLVCIGFCALFVRRRRGGMAVANNRINGVKRVVF